MSKSVVDITSTVGGGTAAGTGVVITSTGEVLTNNHVVQGGTNIRAQIDGSGPTYVNNSTIGVIDQETADVVDTTQYSAFGHGTMVAGIVHLVAPRAQILPLKAFNADGTGYTSDAIRAIYWAVKSNAHVLNMSFSLDTQSPLVQDALTYAKNTVLVASIGNDNSKVDKNYPASYGKVLGIAATDLNDRKTAFSNYGPVADVSAPGEGLISAYPGGLYAVWSGTSAASALVSGESALLLSRKDWKSDELIKRLIDSVDPLHDRYDLGKGRINLKSALDKIK